MKTIHVELYSFSELNDEEKEKALEHFKHINTDYDWWETDYDDFVSICSLIGVHTSPKEIFFRGFWSQGDGSTFTSKIDVLQFGKGISEKASVHST